MNWIALFLAFSTFLTGALQDYLKPAPNKENYTCPLQGIDFIYVINLDRRPEKFVYCLKELEPWGIYPYRFSAVNGWEIPIEEINSLGVSFQRGMVGSFWGTYYNPKDAGQPHHEMIAKYGQYYFSHCMSRGAIGIVLSHLSVIKDALESGYETVWIMEDDIEVLDDPLKLEALLVELQEVSNGDWDILFTDIDTKDRNGNYVPCFATCKRPNFVPEDPHYFNKRKVLSENIRMIGARYGAYSYLIKRSGMQKIVQFFDKYKIFLPYDIDLFMTPHLKVFTVRKDIVSTLPLALSDNGGPNYIPK